MSLFQAAAGGGAITKSVNNVTATTQGGTSYVTKQTINIAATKKCTMMDYEIFLYKNTAGTGYCKITLTYSDTSTEDLTEFSVSSGYWLKCVESKSVTGKYITKIEFKMKSSDANNAEVLSYATQQNNQNIAYQNSQITYYQAVY